MPVWKRPLCPWRPTSSRLCFPISRNSSATTSGQWIRFFLTGVAKTAGNGVATLHQIIDLKTAIESEKILRMGKRSPKAANDLVRAFMENHILGEITGYRRNRLFALRVPPIVGISYETRVVVKQIRSFHGGGRTRHSLNLCKPGFRTIFVPTIGGTL